MLPSSKAALKRIGAPFKIEVVCVTTCNPVWAYQGFIVCKVSLEVTACTSRFANLCVPYFSYRAISIAGPCALEAHLRMPWPLALTSRCAIACTHFMFWHTSQPQTGRGKKESTRRRGSLGSKSLGCRLLGAASGRLSIWSYGLGRGWGRWLGSRSDPLTFLYRCQVQLLCYHNRQAFVRSIRFST